MRVFIVGAVECGRLRCVSLTAVAAAPRRGGVR
jgi:hypothetical protein